MTSSMNSATRTARVCTAALIVLLIAACKPLEPTPASNSTTGSGNAAAATGGTATGSAVAAAAALPPSLIGKDLEAIPTTKKIVALTFDAGGNSAGLAKILSTLTAQQVPGTFFLTGAWANAYPASVKQIVAAGHRLGNHTQTHPHLPTLSDTAATSQITTARTNIMKAGGTDPQPLFRFPYGDRNAHTISLVNKAGYIAVRWTVDTLGWKGTSGGASTSSVVSRVVNAAKPGEIVLMHVGTASSDYAALAQVVDRISAAGYGFVRADG